MTYLGLRPTLVSLLARGDEAMYERMAHLVEPGRRQAAILFADLQDSGDLSRRLPTPRYFDLIRTIVRDGQAAGHFRREISDKIAANCFFGALDAMVTSWLLSERDYNLGNAADALVDVILSGMEQRR